MPSQLGQDRFVLEVLDGLRGGYFLDSGAADGLRSSNTLLLERDYGWRGLCVEPDERFFADLVRNRAATCVNCCLFDREGEAEFLSAGTLGGLMETYQPEHLAFVSRHYRASPGDAVLPKVRKPVRTLATVLAEAGAPTVIDYWSLDTEGSELALLKSFPFETYAFRVLTVEHNRYPVRREIRAFLEARGYAFVRDFGIDDGYVAPGLPGSRSWRSAAWRRR